jgi:hypothetical protein
MKWMNSPAAPDSSARHSPAPAGYGEDTIVSRRQDIELGSQRSLIEARIDATLNALLNQYVLVDDTINEMHRAGNLRSTFHFIYA